MEATCLRSSEIFRMEKRIETDLGINTIKIVPFKSLEPIAYAKGSKSLQITKEGFFRVIPPNDGTAHYTDYFWEERMVINNHKCFNDISGMRFFLERTLDLYRYALENGICVNSQYLFSKLNIRDLKIDAADCLFITDETLKVDESDVSAYEIFIQNLNTYLDLFIGLNFGKILHEDEILQRKFTEFKTELEKYRCRKKAFTLPNISYSKYVLPCDF